MTRKLVSLLTAFAVVISGCSNLFTNFATKDSDAALYEDATKLLNAGDYDAAVLKFQQLSAAYLADNEVRKYYAGALAGKCGLDFTGLLDAMSSADLSTTPFFQYFMNLYDGVSVDPASCTAAEEQIKAIWASRSATSGEQLFMVLLSMAKIGTYLRSKADNDDGTDNLGDGTTDAAFNGCTNTDDDDHLTDEEVTEVVTGLSLLLTNIADVGANFGAGVTGSTSTITTFCGLLTPNPCATTEAANVTPAQVATMRDMLATSPAFIPFPVGIGSCASPTNFEDCCP